MKPSAPVILSGAVEGPVDEAVLARLVQEAGANLGAVYGKKGKDHLLRQLVRFNKAVQFVPWIILVDLDRDEGCAPACLPTWLPNPAPQMCFRIVVHAVEAWLLADGEEMARFLGVSESRIPTNPEEVDDPKRFLVDLARKSRKRQIRSGMVPQPGAGRSVGPEYAARLIEFVRDLWRPKVAAKRSDGLRRCRERIKALVDRQ